MHEPIVGDVGPIRFLGENAVIDGLRDRIRHSDGGSFLVTGFRGAGKTTAVLRTLKDVEDIEPETLDYLPVVLNVARPVSLDQLLFEVVRRLFEALIDSSILQDLSPDVRRALVLAYARTSLSFKETRSQATERTRTLGLGGGSAPVPIVSALKPTLGFSRKKTDAMAMEASFLAYSHGDVEHDFVRILDLLNRPQPPPTSWRKRMVWRARGGSNPWRGRVVVVLDELDKLTATEEGQRTVQELLTGLKNILTTRDAHFIFVGGPELHDASLLDAARGNSVFESVFAHETYVRCLWGASDELLTNVLAPDTLDEVDRATLRDYLDYKSRGIPRLLLRELNDLVRWDRQSPYLFIDPIAESRIGFYADLQRVLRDFMERSELDEAFTLPIDVDRWRLGVYYLTDSILRRRRADFSASEIMGAADSGYASTAWSTPANIAERLIDHLLDAEILRVTWDPRSGTLIEDAPQERRFELHPDVRRRLAALIRDDARSREELSPVGPRQHDHDATVLGTLKQGRYVLKDILGRGGTGTVYRAEDSLLRRQVAIKVLEAESLRSNDRMRSRFRREADVAARLQHPGIVRIFEAFEEDDGRLGIAMELVEGTNLRDLIPLGAASAVEIAIALLDTLTYVQDAGMARVDLKPDNVIVRTEGGPVIVDLGLVKPTAADVAKFDTFSERPDGTSGPLIGTPSYMSPEQLSGARVDIRSDIHALGLVLFEMIAGHQAYQGDSMMKVLVKIVQEDVDVERLPVSPQLRATVAKATARDVDARYQSPAEMRDALLACPESVGPPAHARPEVGPPPEPPGVLRY